MSTRRFLAIIAMAVMSASCVLAQPASRQIVLPTWPKEFKLLAGQKVEFGIPMSAAGDIVVGARWQGSPLTVSLKNSAGQPIASTEARNVLNPPSARLKFSVAAADLQNGSILQVSIAAPGRFAPESAPVATGQVSIQSPPITELQVQAIVEKLRPAMTAQLTALQAKRLTPPTVTAEMRLANTRAEALTASTTENRKQEAVLQTQMGVNLATYCDQVLRSATVPVKATALSATGLARARLTRLKTINTAIANQPTLTDVTPKQAMPGDQVVLSGNNLPLDKSQSEVRFVIGNGIDVPASIVSVQQGDGVKYQVQVPGDPSATGAYDGQVYMNIKTSSIATNSLDFHFAAAPLATITSTAPITGGPGDMLLLNGQNFGPNDTVFFLWGTGAPVQTPDKQYFSPQQIRVKVPDYSSKQPISMLIYVVGKGLVNGPLYSIAMQPTTPEIASLVNASGKPEEPVMISGSGFRSPLEVHFVDQSGNDRTAAITSSDPCSILTHVPNVTGVIGDSPWKVYVKSVGIASVAKDFTFKPAMDTQLLDVKAAGIKNDSAVDGVWGEGKSLDQLMDWFNGHWDYWEYGYTSPNTTIAASHRGGQFWGRGGIDTYFRTFCLKNGWLVQSVNFDVQYEPGESLGSLILSKPGTPYPLACVLWGDSPDRDMVNYSLSFTIRGPKGVPYM